MTDGDCSDALRCAPVAYGSAEHAATVALRGEVLRKPLGLHFSEEQLRAESGDHHLACFRSGRIVACLVLSPLSDGVMKMRQVAVAADCQRRGIGTTLVLYAERFAARLGCCEMTMHAREAAVPFYAKLGYSTVGERFIEVSIPHFEMRKRLPPPT